MSIKEGMYSLMIQSAVGSYSGYLQINTSDFTSDGTLDNGFVFTQAMSDDLNGIKSQIKAIPRIENFALSAYGDKTRGTLVLGTDIIAEKELTQIDERIISGSCLSRNDKGVLLGKGLAEYLNIAVADTIVLLGQGYHGTSAAGKFAVKGIVSLGSPELSKQLVVMDLGNAQQLYSAPGVITQLNIWPSEDAGLQTSKTLLAGIVGNEMDIRTWKEVMPEIDKMIQADRVEGYVFMFILYLVISFGIFGTLLMMLVERAYEFGMLLSIGMKRMSLAFMVWLEALFLSLAGAMIGIAGAIPVCYYFNQNPIRFGDEFNEMFEEYGFEPIMKASMDLGIFFEQALIIAALSSILALYPVLKIFTMNILSSRQS